MISISFRGPEGCQPFTSATKQEAAVPPMLLLDHAVGLFSVYSETCAATSTVKVRTCSSPQQEAPSPSQSLLPTCCRTPGLRLLWTFHRNAIMQHVTLESSLSLGAMFFQALSI